MKRSIRTLLAIALLFLFSRLGVLPVFGLQSSQSLPSYGVVALRVIAQRPYVEGARIMVNGSEFVPIGVIKGWSVVYYKTNGYPPTNWPDETEGVYNLLNDPSTLERETKFNIVMLAENRWLWENDPNYIPALHDIVEMCTKRGLYVIIRYHEWINRDDGSPEFDEEYMTWEDKVDIIVELDGWRDHVVSIAEEFKDKPTVIGIAPLNEPTPLNKGWTAKGYTAEEAQEIWHNHSLQIVDAIHAVDSSYIIFIPPKLGYYTLTDAVPWSRPNIVYCVHWYYGWDTEYNNDYADVYWNAKTEEDFQDAYSVMVDHYQRQMLDFSERYNVPVMNSETSMCKVSYKTGNPCKNTERQFQDQMRLGAEKGFGQLYWQHDRNKNDRYWGLLDLSNPETWSEGGSLVKEAVNKYY